jgi:myosin heavy subunit
MDLKLMMIIDVKLLICREKYANKYRNELPPHVYATSSAAYRDLCKTTKNQSILVSGESGAGKTETVKILMNHFASIASNQGYESFAFIRSTFNSSHINEYSACIRGQNNR